MDNKPLDMHAPQFLKLLRTTCEESAIEGEVIPFHHAIRVHPCIGLVVSRLGDGLSLLGEAMIAARYQDYADDLLIVLRSTCEDAMGRDLVLYWPRMTWPEGVTYGE